MRRPVDVPQVLVGSRVVIGVANQNGERSAGRIAGEHARKDLGTVRFVTLCDEAALAGAATVEVTLQIFGVDCQARRAAVNHDSHAGTVGFAESGDSKESA